MNYFSQMVTHQSQGKFYGVRIGGNLESREFRAFVFSGDSVTVLGNYSRVIDAHRAAIQLITKGYCYAD